MKKVSVTLDDKVVAEVKALVGAREFSAYVNSALERSLQGERIRALLAELDEEYGPVSPEVQAEVEARAREWPR